MSIVAFIKMHVLCVTINRQQSVLIVTAVWWVYTFCYSLMIIGWPPAWRTGSQQWVSVWLLLMQFDMSQWLTQLSVDLRPAINLCLNANDITIQTVKGIQGHRNMFGIVLKWLSLWFPDPFDKPLKLLCHRGTYTSSQVYSMSVFKDILTVSRRNCIEL